MSDLGIYAYDAPTGRRLDTPNPRKAVFSVGGALTPADDHRLKVARQYFTEVRAEDFDQEGKEGEPRHGYPVPPGAVRPNPVRPPAGLGRDGVLRYVGRLPGLPAAGRCAGQGQDRADGGRGGAAVSEQRKYLTMGDWLAAKAAGLDAGRRPVSEQFYRPTPGELPPPVPPTTP